MAGKINVNIKMYKVGELGDCFLLCFKNGIEQSNVLIDCGSFRNSAKSIARMKAIAEDIKTQLAGAKLNVVVGTHQHNDHLSGFVHAKKIFEKIAPEQIWLSWLDDPKDKLARQIGKDFNNYLTSLRLISKELNHSWFSDHPAKEQLNKMLAFYGVKTDGNLGAKTDDLPPAMAAEAKDILKKLGRKKPAYLSPGDNFSLPGIEDGAVKVYVLGPPRNQKALYDKEPSEGETFDPKLALNSMNAAKLMYAVKKYTGSVKEENDEEPFPFNEPERESLNYQAVWDSYYAKENEWRQIDLDWINQASQLALWLDGFTNNSSLVLAFEIVSSNKVLLFAADAQTGNWTSWKTIKWKQMPSDFNWLNLLENTVLYKTGHHGSHNSTLPEGLNNMIHEELVVMIPVDKTDPNIKKEKKPWEMPAHNLYKQLKKRSQNRILRMDEGISKSEGWLKLPLQPNQTELYVEYEIKG